MAVSEAPHFGHQLKDVTLDEGQPAHFETTLTPVNDATMRVINISKLLLAQNILVSRNRANLLDFNF